MIEKKDIEKIIERVEVFNIQDKINKINLDLSDLENQFSTDQSWDNPEYSKSLNQKISYNQKKLLLLKEILELQDLMKTSRELKEELEEQRFYKKLNNSLQSLENQRYLNGRFDSKNVYLSLYSGAGGIDAEDFTAMLTSMYQSFCKIQDWKCSLINLSKGKEGGVKSAMLQINGENAYGLLKEEVGVHRLIRISPFNSGNTRETSFAAVEVLPQGVTSEVGDFQIKNEDLKIDYFMSSGKGGQSVNTTYSAVRITHIPTKISVSCQNERNQIQNKNQALEVLKDRLAILELQKQKEYIQDIKGISKSIEWGSQIRTYTLHPYKMVKDHRSGKENSNPETFFEGSGLIEMIWSVKHTNKF